MRFINDIILHCTATPPGMDVDAKTIGEWHKQRGWKGIGYHYVIRIDGTIERGRPISTPGAHCKGHNAHSVGVCYVGGVDANGVPADTRTQWQKSALLKLLANLTFMYRCRCHGHNEYDHGKACPSFDVQNEYGGLYDQIVLHSRDTSVR